MIGVPHQGCDKAVCGCLRTWEGSCSLCSNVYRHGDKKLSGLWRGEDEAKDSVEFSANLSLLQKAVFAVSVVGDT